MSQDVQYCQCRQHTQAAFAEHKVIAMFPNLSQNTLRNEVEKVQLKVKFYANLTQMHFFFF